MFQKKGIDGYFFMDQMARMKFRLLHLLLEICKQAHEIVSLPGGVSFGPTWEHVGNAPWNFHVCFRVER